MARKAYKYAILAPSTEPTDSVRSMLESRGLRPALKDESTALPHGPLALQAIERADVIVAVARAESANVFLELGYALALGKRIIALVPSEVTHLPTYLRQMTVLRGDSIDSLAVAIAVDELLIRLDKEPRGKTRSKAEAQDAPLAHSQKVAPMPKVTIAPRRLSDAYVSEYLAHPGMSETGMQILLKRALEDLGVDALSEAKGDFALWSSDLDKIGANPLFIEIKRTLPRGDRYNDVARQVSQQVMRSGARWGLVLYAEGPPPVMWGDAPNVIFARYDEFLWELTRSSLGRAIRELRNRRVHGG